ncbi:MAG TPA: hypothetical protein VL996_03555, partial [Methylocella sp.]|nr:hypothetical protein [Methylocella sp.]
FFFDRLNLPTPLDTYSLPGCWCGPSYFVGPDGIQRIVTSHGSSIQTWHVNSPSLGLNPVGSADVASSEQDPGFFTVVSSNGTQNGSAIIWAVSRPVDDNPALVNLYAFNAIANWDEGWQYTLLYSSPAGSWPNTGGNANIVPVVANGKVYVATNQLLTIFGAGGGNAAKVAPKLALQPNQVASPGSLHLISGTVTAIDRSILTLQTRTGKSVKIDDAQAVRNDRVVAPLSVGLPLTVRGSLIEGNGALLATVIGRAKGTSGELWPQDR